MAGGINPFGFSVGVSPAPRSRRGAADIPSAPFGFAPPPSKVQQTLAILNEYNPLPAFERLMKSPMALGGPISEQDIADGLMVAGTVTGGSAAAPKPKNALNMGIRAFHGSPHDFDRFDMSKIGTGEGAQAYGHGLYFADSEGVAKSYRDKLSSPVYDQGVSSAWIKQAGGDSAKAETLLKEHVGYDRLKQRAASGDRNAQIFLDETDGILAGIRKPHGRMYEVEINADPEQFLDWDKPLSEQSPAIADALRKIGFEDAKWPYTGLMGPNSMLTKHSPGQEIYNAVGKERGSNSVGSPRDINKVGASEALRDAGIPGIKYLDAGSRAAGDGSRNYVVFDQNLISIVRKYGIAGASAMLGYNILDGMDPAQADELKRIEGNQ